MSSIYDTHEKTFRDVAAYVVTNTATGERVATVAFKYARSGLRTTCFLHVLGVPMVRAHASGGGYDKASAAVYGAVKRMKVAEGVSPLAEAYMQTFKRAITDGGKSWDRELRDAGFNVFQAV